MNIDLVIQWLSFRQVMHVEFCFHKCICPTFQDDLDSDQLNAATETKPNLNFTF